MKTVELTDIEYQTICSILRGRYEAYAALAANRRKRMRDSERAMVRATAQQSLDLLKAVQAKSA